MILEALLFGLLGASIGITLGHIKIAPAGWQDQQGFHFGEGLDDDR